MSIFEFKDYRAYLRDHIAHLPKKGRGELSKMALHLNVNTTLISQILSGTRDFSFEQAYSLSIFIGHSELETEYFSLLVQIERAGTAELKKYLQKKLELVKSEALKLSQRIFHEKKLTPQQRSTFYSSWIYSAVHLFASTKDKGVTLDEVTERFGLSKLRTKEVMEFLLTTGLCAEKNHRYVMGVQSTFVERGSPELLKHLSNWRLRAINKSEALAENELMYSGQFSLSKKDFEKLREQLANFLKEANQLVKDSPAEEIACLNLDWFWIQ
jgi:uncharacterized protein (TIGR02147 family)